MLGTKLNPTDFLKRLGEECTRVDPASVKNLADLMWERYEAGRMIFVIGNGGSGSNASHFCEDIGKGTLKLPDDLHHDGKKRFRILSLTDNTPYILAWANDEGFERVFVEQLRNLASPGDLLVAISGSGNSKNILLAVEWAKRNGVTTFGCTGFSGGKLKTLADHNLHSPIDDMGIVETVHLAAFHWVVDDLHRRASM
jgi:D-sedoheptulose 7-phosphate isomerase